jgi:RsmE family RNA methyltransferase
LLLSERDRLVAGGIEYRLTGARADHVRSVLAKGPGDSLKCGLVGVGTGQGRILSDDGQSLRLELCELSSRAPPRLEIILAMPRPKALSRVLQAVASFGVARLDLIGGYRVDKAYFDSPRLASERLLEDLRLGCEQGVQVHLPAVGVEPRFGHFVEQVLGARPSAPGFLLHPQASRAFPASAGLGPARLALGPEGGWTQGELRAFENHGFEPITLGPAVLRTEVAVAAALGQLQLLEAQRLSGT